VDRLTTSSPTRARRSTAKRTIVSVAVTLVCLWILLRLVDIPALLAIIGSASLPLILLAVAIRCADRVVMIGKWFPLLRVQLPGARFGTAARAYIVSGLANYLVPLSVGSDVLRAAMLGRGEGVIPEVGASIIAERLLGLAATGILSLLALVIAVRSSLDLTFLFPWAIAAIALGFVALLAPTIGPFTDLLSRWLGRFRHVPAAGFVAKLALSYRVYGSHRMLLALVGAASVLEQLTPVLFAYVIATALGISVTVPMLLVAVPLALFAARIPPSIGGIGIAEGSMVYLLSLFGIPVEQALAMTLIGRSIDILVVAVPGAVLWRDILRAPPIKPGAAGRTGNDALTRSRLS
jgi:uncharacterized protein (TIRG00374 family)